MVLIIAAVLVFAVMAGIIIYNKIQMSQTNRATRQNPGVSRVPLNNVNDLNPPTIWNTQPHGASTNTTTPLRKPIASETNAD